MSQPRQSISFRENMLLTIMNRSTESIQPGYLLTVLLSLALVFLFAFTTNAQSTANYTFSTATTASLTDTSGSTSLLALSTYHDDVASAVTNIGFPFYFMGTAYTQFSINSNGHMALGSTVIGGTQQSSPSATYPLLVPITGDNAIRTTGRVSYKVTGSNPNQVLVVQWSDLRVPLGSSVETGTYCTIQVRLYQATGAIEFVYGQMYNMGTAQTRGIFFSSNTTAGKVGVVENLLTTPTYNSGLTTVTTYSFTGSASMTNLNSASDGSRRIFTFTPQSSVPADPTTLTYTSVLGTSMTVNWVDNSSSETFFIVTRATDAGFTQNLVTTTVACTTTATTGTSYSSAQTGMAFGTTYYFKVQAANEGLAPSTGLTGSQATSSPSLSGTKTVGSTGDYATLTAAFAAITANGLSGALTLELQSTYTSGSETFPLVTPSTTYTGVYVVTVRPQTGVGSTLTITSSNATATLDINGGQNWVIDGRPGGSGSNKYLTITNTNAAGPAIRFINEASNNTVTYCVLSATANVSTSSGVVFFSTTTGSNGNDNNTLSYNNLNGLGAAQGIYSSGTTTTTAHNNSGNTISNNNIYDVYISNTSTTSTKFISIQSGNTDWTISSNSFYFTASRTYSSTANTHHIIHISNVTSGNNFSISSNTFGGNASDNTGTWTVASGGNSTWRVMELSVGTTTPTSIQGNTIKNMSLNTAFATAGSSAWIGIFLSSGAFNVGTTSGNTIGNMSGTGSIVINHTAATGGIVSAINCSATGGVTISNNSIGGISNTVTTATTLSNLYLLNISSASGSVTISNNTVGGTVANSILNSTGNTTTNFNTRGMQITSTGTVTVSGNTVQNLSMTSTNTGPSLHGIYVTVSSATSLHYINNNTVKNLSTTATRTTTGAAGPLIGIAYVNATGTAGGNTISGNTVYGLSQTGGSAVVPIYGIYHSATSGTNRSFIEKNLVYGISSTSTGASVVVGIYNTVGASVIRNNMVRLGLDASGASITLSHQFWGIWKEQASQVTVVHNNIYIGGSGVGTGTASTFAFRRSTAAATDTVMNNILVNARSNGTSTGSHYAIYLTNTTTLVSNYNIFYVTGTGGVLGSADGGTTPRATLSAWQTATTFDANSASGNPQYVDPTGVTPDLHVASTNPAEGAGLALTICTDDFDGSIRSGLTPTDIGADAGNFTGQDIFIPILSYTALTNGTSNNRTLTNFATITDNIGVSSGGSAPRLYYKRSTDGDVFNDNTSGTDGWKYVTGTGPSPYSFTIDYSLLNGGTGVTQGNTIQYFVVAQDDANNLVSLPTGATASTNPPVQNINGKATTPNTYNIVAGLSGTKTVGTGGDYTTLTAAGGLFAAINASALSGNLTVNIISDITTEDGTNSLSQIAEDGAGGYTVTIQSDGNPWTISNGALNVVPMINIDGADRVIITGGTGDTRNLTFRNTHVTAGSAKATIQYNSGSVNCVLQNVIVENNSTSATQGSVMVGATGTNSVSLFNNVIRDAVGGTTGAYNNGFYMSNSTGTVTMQYNKFVNFINSGINIAAAAANASFVNNSFYQTATAPATVTAATAFNGIALTSTNGNHTISGNYFGGQDSLCGGSAYSNTSTVSFKAITVSASTTSPTSIQGNTVQNINLSSASTSAFWGIYTTAGAFNIGTVTGNTIGHNSTSNSITYAGSGIVYGIIPTATTTCNIQNNIVANILASGTGTGVQIYGIYLVGNTITNPTITGNTIHDLSTASTKTIDVESGTSANTNAVIVGILTTSTATNQVISQNTLYNFSATTTAVTNVAVVGIGDNAGATASFITRNKIYGFTNTATGTTTLPGIVGIRPYSGAFTVANNMISLTNGANTNGVKIYGMSNAATGTNNFYYNSVYIGGSPNTGVAVSGAMTVVYSSSTSVVRDNILYNARTNSGSATGNHYASYIGTTTVTGYTSNHNLFVTTSSLTAAYKNPTVYTFGTWRTSAGYDFQSFMDTTANLSAANLFTDVTTADLNINVNNTESWAVNQRGLPIAGMTDDFGATSVRTTTLPGATDIGADEMTPVASQPAAAPSAPPALNSASNFLDNGRTLGTLTFGSGGTAPSAITFTQYRATNPPGSLTGRYANTYWHIANTGGSGFSYDLVLYYDSTMLGTIPFESNIRLAKSEDGGTTWTGYIQLGTFPNGVALDTVNNKLTVYGLTQFSDFTLTDGTNPLPVELQNFSATVQGRTVNLNWLTATEVNVSRFEIERSLPVEHGDRGEWTKVGEVVASGNSNSQKEYTFTDKLNKTGKFIYRLKMIDNDGTKQYSQAVNAEIAAPKDFALLQNYPNPFNPNTKISFEVPVTSSVKLMVYNSNGELVRVLENGMLEAGVYERNFDAKGLSSGLYLYVLQANGKQMTKKMVLMK